MVKKWSRDELLVALGLYCRLPFGQFHQKNPAINQAAQAIGRSPSALAMKLSNFASLDPVITDSGRKGLHGASALDKEVWQQFTENTEEMVPLAETSLNDILNESAATPNSEENPFAEEDHFGQVKIRRGQKLFRDAVLSAYDNRCCVTGVADPRFLVASHIRPWREDKANRLNPRNGMCLSLMVDKAFDLGLITFTEDYRLLVSSELQKQENNPHMVETFLSRKGESIRLPNKFSPENNLLEWHRKYHFLY